MHQHEMTAFRSLIGGDGMRTVSSVGSVIGVNRS